MGKNAIITGCFTVLSIATFMVGYSLGKINGWSDGFRTATGSSACKVTKRDYFDIVD